MVGQLTLLALLFLGSEFGGMVLLDTEIHERPSVQDAVVVGIGTGFFLNRTTSSLYSFSFQTGSFSLIARPGQGPGLLDRADRVFWMNGRLLVRGRNGWSTFDANGMFTHRVVPPERSAALPTKDGWFLLEGLAVEDHEKPLTAVLYGPDFERRTVLTRWPSERERGAREGVAKSLEVDPTRLPTLFRVDSSGRFAYVCPMGTDEITILDLGEQKVIETLRLDLPRVPFDEAWGQRVLDTMRQDFKRRGWSAVRVVEDFPEFFPAIRQFGISARDRLIVEAWLPDLPTPGSLPKPLELHVFDLRGGPLPPDALDRLWYHLIRDDGSFLYLWVFDQESDEYTLGRCHRDELNSFLEKYPLTDPSE